MNADAVLTALHQQLDQDVAAYLRTAHARGEAVAISLYMTDDRKVGTCEVKIRPGKKKAECA